MRNTSRDHARRDKESASAVWGQSRDPIYFWRPPVGHDESFRVGRQMLIFTVAWPSFVIGVGVLLSAVFG